MSGSDHPGGDVYGGRGRATVLSGHKRPKLRGWKERRQPPYRPSAA